MSCHREPSDGRYFIYTIHTTIIVHVPDQSVQDSPTYEYTAA